MHKSLNKNATMRCTVPIATFEGSMYKLGISYRVASFFLLININYCKLVYFLKWGSWKFVIPRDRSDEESL